MFALLLAAGCSSLHEDQPSVHFPENNQPVFHANLSNESLTYLGEDIEFSWAAKDQVSIFTGNTRNKLYEFTGETGDNAGELKYAGKNSFGFGEALNANYAIYPYSETTTINESGVIGYTWPATQTYAENGIGYGANVMVAASSSVDSHDLVFKSVGGYLRVSLYGEMQGVSSIELTSNAGEPLAGASLISATVQGKPSCTMTGKTTTLTLACEDTVLVGATKVRATDFWVVLPATTLAEGFTLKVNGIDDKSQEFKVEGAVDFNSKAYSLERQLTDLTVPAEYYGADEVRASINAETRTYLDQNGTTTYWLAGDEIGVFTMQGSANLKFTTPTSADAWAGKFRGTLNGEVPVCAYYPYSESAGEDMTALSLYLEPEQSVDNFGMYDFKASFSATRDTGNTSMDFKGLLTLLTFRVNAIDTQLMNYNLKSVTLQVLPLTEGGDAPAVAGEFTLDLSASNATNFTGETFDYAKIVWPEAVSLASGVIEAPMMINNASVVSGTSFLITIETEEGHKAIIKRSTTKNYAANTRYTMTLNMSGYTSDQIEYIMNEPEQPEIEYVEGNPFSSVKFLQADNRGKLLKSSLFDRSYSNKYYTNVETAYDITCTYNAAEGVWEGVIPYLYDFSGLVADFTTDDPAATVTVNDVEQISGTTANDFNTKVTYTVANSNGTYQQAVVRLKNTGLPVVVVTGNDGQAPYPKATDFDEIKKTFTIDINGTVHLGAVRLRGNSTQEFPKKPYAIKLEDKVEVLGMPKHKRWVLLANWLDRTLLRNDLAFYLAHQTDTWAPHGEPVELVLNNVHVGNYYLCEQIKIDKNRVNIADVGYDKLSEQTEAAAGAELGYLLECDQSADDTEIYFKVSSPVPFYVYVKDPGSDYYLGDNTKTSKHIGITYIKNYFAEVGTALSSKNWTKTAELLDYRSFVDHWIMTELTMNQESKHPKSFYMHKDAGGKLCAGPAWDYDWCTFVPQNKMGTGGGSNSTAGKVQDYFSMRYTMWYQYLFNDPAFKALAKERWAVLKPKMETALTHLDKRAALVKLSDSYNWEMWPLVGKEPNGWYGFPNSDEDMTFDEAIATMRSSLSARIKWLDTEINKL